MFDLEVEEPTCFRLQLYWLQRYYVGRRKVASAVRKEEITSDKPPKSRKTFERRAFSYPEHWQQFFVDASAA